VTADVVHIPAVAHHAPPGVAPVLGIGLHAGAIADEEDGN
jgi:hypothetical protein